MISCANPSQRHSCCHPSKPSSGKPPPDTENELYFRFSECLFKRTMQYSRVLLIDDDEDDQELFLQAIKEIASSIECITLDDARSALTQLENRSLTADLIFLDLNMPIMTGQQFL